MRCQCGWPTKLLKGRSGPTERTASKAQVNPLFSLRDAGSVMLRGILKLIAQSSQNVDDGVNRPGVVVINVAALGDSNRMLKKSPSGVLASLRGSTYRSVRLASSLAAALLDSLFEHPGGILALALGINRVFPHPAKFERGERVTYQFGV